MEEPRRLGGRYELGAVLGRGGMAEVYLGRDIRLGRSVAVKTLRTDLARDPSFQARFRREAQSAASLNHPAIVAVYDTGEDYIDGISIPYIVMEYVDGSTLRELLHSGRRLLPERALEMTGGVLQALEYSHRNGIIHRDIKPANVMLTRQGTIKVMDFGIARAMADNGMTMTQTAAVIGTAQYLSPEQARGETVDARSDLYSTGCLLYELLTERPPFVGDSPVAVAYQHVREDPLPPSAFDPEVSPAIDAIVLKSLAKSPDHRYQSADEMRADIERALHGMPVAAAPAALGQMEAATQYLPPTPAAPPPAMTGRHSVPPSYELGPEDHYDDEPPRRKGAATWVLLGIACIAVLVAGFFLAKNFTDSKGNDVATVPSLVGKTEAQARTSLESVDLVLKVGPAEACDQPKDAVCRQTPEAETELKKGNEVTVFLSTGPKKVKIPTNIKGATQAEATKRLEELNLKVDVDLSTKYTCDKGTVCQVEPSEGTEIAQGETVKLKVSAGKETHPMPDVVGKSMTDAQNQLLGLNIRVQVKYAADNAPQFTVIAQSIPKGDTVVEGNTVTLTVSNGPATTAPPSSSAPPTTSPSGRPTDANNSRFSWPDIPQQR